MLNLQTEFSLNLSPDTINKEYIQETMAQSARFQQQLTELSTQVIERMMSHQSLADVYRRNLRNRKAEVLKSDDYKDASYNMRATVMEVMTADEEEAIQVNKTTVALYKDCVQAIENKIRQLKQADSSLRMSERLQFGTQVIGGKVGVSDAPLINMSDFDDD